MGFFSSNKKSTSASTYTPNVPQWLKDYYESNTKTAANLANATADERVAGFSEDQLAVQGALRNLLGQGYSNYQSGIDAILGQLSGGTGNFGPDSYKPFMNPYINEVIQNQNNELVRTGDINRNKIRSNAAMTNAFGSGRADLMEQEANRNLNEQVSNNTQSGLASAFNWANNMALQANQANTANTTGLASALGSLTGAQSSNAISQANALNTVGTQQQQLAQAQLDVPYNNVSWLSGILGQVPASIYGATTTNQTSTPGAGWGSQLLGAATTLGGAYLTGGASLGMGGLGSIFNGGGLNSMLQSGLNSGGGLGQGITWNGPRVGGFADGGHITHNYVGGGDTIGAAPSSFVDLYRRIKGGYISPALEGLSDGLSSAFENFGKPSQVIDPATGKMVPNTETYKPEREYIGERLLPTGYTSTKEDNQRAAYSNVDDSLIKEQEAAMADALAKKQAAAPKTGPVDPERSFMDQILNNGGMLPPPVESQSPEQPSSAVTDVTQNIVAPTVEATQRQAKSSIIAKYLEQQKGSEADTPRSETTWMDRINLPLVMAGAAMMGSDKPFFGAVSEGIGAGAGQLQRERAAKADSESKAKENAQKLLDSLVNANYREQQIRQNEERIKNSKEAVDVQKGFLQLRKENSDVDNQKAMEFARKQTEAELKLFMNTPQGMKASKEQLDTMRKNLQNKYAQDYLNGSFGSGVAMDIPPSVQSDLNDNSENTGGMLDYNTLLQKYRQ